MAADDIGNGNNTPDVDALAAATIQAIGNALDNPSNAVSQSSVMPAIRQELYNDVSDAQKALADANSTPATNAVPTPAASTLTQADISAGVSAALVNQGLSQAQIQAAVQAALAAQSAGLNYEQASSAFKDALIAEGLTLQQISIALAPLAPTGVQTGVEAALVAKGLTQAGIQTAVHDAVNDATGVQIPTDTPIVIPTKLSLTTVMASFMASIGNLPMLQTLRGLTINCSGSSQLCLALPSALGGSKCINGTIFQDSLNMVGTVLLSLTTLFCFIDVFRG
jgi:hypothetical protein